MMPRGGRREGAGAPQKHGEPTKMIAARLPRSVLTLIDRIRKKLGLTRTEALVEAVREWLRAHTRKDDTHEGK